VGAAGVQGRVWLAMTATCAPRTTLVSTLGANKSLRAQNAYGMGGTKPIPTATPPRQIQTGGAGAHPT